MGRGGADQTLLVLRSRQLRAWRERHVDARLELFSDHAREHDERQCVRDRRHRSVRTDRRRRLAMAERRRDSRSRGSAVGRFSRVRQRHGRRLQRRDPPGRQPVSRRRDVLRANPKADEPQHDGCAGMPRRIGLSVKWPAVSPRSVARYHGPTDGSVRPRQVLVLRIVRVSERLRFAARYRSVRAGEVDVAARVLQVQLQHHAESPADARLSQRLLGLPGSSDSLHRAERRCAVPRRQPHAEPGVHRRFVEQDVRGSASGRLLRKGFRRSVASR